MIKDALISTSVSARSMGLTFVTSGIIIGPEKVVENDVVKNLMGF